MPTVKEITDNVLRLSNELESLGDRMEDISARMYELKQELDRHTEEQHRVIRESEREGKYTVYDRVTQQPNLVKLTEAIRESIAREDKIDLFAEYEALKRKSDRLQDAIRAKTSALSGWQTLAGIEKKMLETLEFQP